MDHYDPQSGSPDSASTGLPQPNDAPAEAVTHGRGRRRRAAIEAAAVISTTQNEEEGQEKVEQNDPDYEKVDMAANAVEERKRKYKEYRELHRIKMHKNFKKERRRFRNEDDDAVARILLSQKQATREQNASLAGQTENCALCQQRFTVTPYSRAGPNGGLLCTKCGKAQADKDDAKKKDKAANGPAGRGRKEHRKKQVGIAYGTGTKSLVTLCVETLAENIGLADSFGELSPFVTDRIARMLSKRRLMNSRTLELFLQSQPEKVCVYDASQLEQQDYRRIFQLCPNIKELKLYNAIQFRDEVVEYLIERKFTLEHLYLSGANLLTSGCWSKYLKAKGGHLKSLRVYFTDQQFDENVLIAIKTYCHSLLRIKIYNNQQISDSELEHIAAINSLRHVSLHLAKESSTETYASLIRQLGGNLETFSIKMVPQVGDKLLEEIHENCTQLWKLRITHSEVMTDAGFVKLFSGWKNKALRIIDFEKCLPIAGADPEENPDLGLGSNGFRAMMDHSGGKLKKLNILGCRRISGEAFEEVFSPGKKYPDLVELEVSFCESMTDYIAGLIFKCCPNLKKLIVFGCMKVQDVQVPHGKVLIGLPSARGMSIYGIED